MGSGHSYPPGKAWKGLGQKTQTHFQESPPSGLVPFPWLRMLPRDPLLGESEAAVSQPKPSCADGLAFRGHSRHSPPRIPQNKDSSRKTGSCNEAHGFGTQTSTESPEQTGRSQAGGDRWLLLQTNHLDSPALLDMLTAPSQRHPWGLQPRASCSSDTWEQAGSLSEREWTPGHHAVSSCAQSALLRPPSSRDVLCLLSWGSPALFPALL